MKGEFLWVVVTLVVLTVVELGLLLSLLFYFSLVVTMVMAALQIFGNKQKSALANKIARADFYFNYCLLIKNFPIFFLHLA